VQLEGLIRTLDKGIVPDSLNLYGAKFEAELVRDVAQRLLQGLILPPAMRRNPRRKLSVRLNVANGFFKMLEKTDVSLNFGADESEIWRWKTSVPPVFAAWCVARAGWHQDRLAHRQQAGEHLALGRRRGQAPAP